MNTPNTVYVYDFNDPDGKAATRPYSDGRDGGMTYVRMDFITKLLTAAVKSDDEDVIKEAIKLRDAINEGNYEYCYINGSHTTKVKEIRTAMEKDGWEYIRVVPNPFRMKFRRLKG